MAAIAFAVTTATAFADDWTVTRLRGTVQVLVDEQWQPLARGDVIPDERSIFTRSNGYATLVRGNEAIELGPNTKIEIYDQGGRKPFTTILQHAGTLTVDAEVRNVQHFAVKTAYLAAVVKGTRFTVTAKRSGGSVEVLRGQVSVEDKRAGETVMVLAGQKAAVSKNGSMKVTGKPKAGTKSPAKTTSGGTQTNTGGSNSNTTPTDGGTKHADDNTSGNSSNNPDKTGQSGGTPSNTSSTTTSDTSSGGGGVVEVATNTVEAVVDTTTHTVDTVVDKTTDVVDKVGDTVDKVTNTTVAGTTVGTLTDTLDKTTKGLTGLLGKKPKGH